MTEPIAGDRQNTIHRRFELQLPVSAVGLQSKHPDMGDVHGMLAVDE